MCSTKPCGLRAGTFACHEFILMSIRVLSPELSVIGCNYWGLSWFSFQLQYFAHSLFGSPSCMFSPAFCALELVNTYPDPNGATNIWTYFAWKLVELWSASNCHIKSSVIISILYRYITESQFKLAQVKISFIGPHIQKGQGWHRLSGMRKLSIFRILSTLVFSACLCRVF